MKRSEYYLRVVKVQRVGSDDVYFANFNMMKNTADYRRSIYEVPAVHLKDGLASEVRPLRIDSINEDWIIDHDAAKDDHTGRIHALVALVSNRYEHGQQDVDMMFAAKWIIASCWDRWNEEGLQDKDRQAEMERCMPRFPTMSPQNFKSICSRELKLKKSKAIVTQNSVKKLHHK
jgi:hypothetical protein